ncbi:hypothetical protein PC121_g15872 [Phytophthora cactorum]|nr:hypothetical protein PC121_g15872 [Phytophthora cactorum]
MLRCNRGFVTKLKEARVAVGTVTGIVANWCGSHQLNLVVDNMLRVLDEFDDFRSTLGYDFAFTHTHESVKKPLASCPTYAMTRWDSAHASCQFLADNYMDLIKLQKEKKTSKILLIVVAVFVYGRRPDTYA